MGQGSGFKQTSSRAKEWSRAVASNRPVLELWSGPGKWLQMDQFYSWDRTSKTDHSRAWNRASAVTLNRPVGIGPGL